jgi:hypothetical protein
MSAIIFSSVTAFVEQVGRRKQFKYGDLDTLVCTWNGPAVAAQTFKPKVNSPHPEFPMMFCTDSQIVAQAALVCDVEATYLGIIQSGGTGKYVTPGVVSTSPVQGSRDFEIPYGAIVGNTGTTTVVGTPTGSQTGQQVFYQGPLYAVGTQRINVRYIGSQCSVHYQVYPRPDPNHPNYPDLGKSLVKWQILSQYKGEISVTATGVIPAFAPPPPVLAQVPPIFAAYLGMQMTQKGQWYDVVENYGPAF